MCILGRTRGSLFSGPGYRSTYISPVSCKYFVDFEGIIDELQ